MDRDRLLQRLQRLDPADERSVEAASRESAAELKRRIIAMPFEPVRPWRTRLRRGWTPTVRRVGVIVTALGVAAAGLIVPARLFGTDPHRPGASGSEVLIASGRDVDSDETDLYLIALDGSAPRRLASPGTDEMSPTWSPGGDRIAFARQSPGGASADIVISQPDGTGERVISHLGATGGWASPTWSPDGTRLAYVSANGVHVVDLGDGVDTIVADPAEQLASMAVTGLTWSPDGSRFALVGLADDEFGLSHVYVMDADGSDLRRVTERDVLGERLAWSPDGRTIVFMDVTFELRSVDVETGRTRVLTSATETTGSGRVVGLSRDPTFSPDGSRIAFLRNSTSGEFDIFVMRSDGSDVRPITDEVNTEFMGLSWR